MRIIAGAWRGRRLSAPPGDITRPTADRTRETLFSMLASRLGSFEGLRVADLFAGSGALGLEAISRGAGSGCFVEQDRVVQRTLRDNIAQLGATDRCEVRPGSALALTPGPAFDLILADPPYRPGAGTEVVRAVLAADWLAPGGWLAVETARGDPVEAAGLSLEAERDTGAARLTLLRRG